MKISKKIIDQYNKELFNKLFPDKETPIFGNSVTDTNDKYFNMSFQEIANEHLKEILEHQEFDLEFEELKNNLLSL
jgi:hypothetical protein